MRRCPARPRSAPMRIDRAAFAAALAVMAIGGKALAAAAPTASVLICTSAGLQEIVLDANGQPLPPKPRHTDTACHFLCAERRQRPRG